MEHVSAFVGALGNGAHCFHVPALRSIFPTATPHQLGEFCLVAFSTSPATPAIESSAPRRLWCKGPPLFGRNVSDLTSENLSERDGKFAICQWDGKHLRVATDVLGYGPLFYATQDGTLYFSTHLGILLSALPRFPALDRLGTVSLIATRGSLCGMTPFSGVRRLQHSSKLTAAIDPISGSATVEVERYCDLAALLRAVPPEGMDANERFGEVLEESLERERIRDDATILLSGGRDSRALVLALRNSGHDRLTTLTFGEARSNDVNRARLLCARLGLKFHRVPYEDWTFESFASRLILLGGGMCGLQVSQFVPGFQAAGLRGRPTVVGFLGNPLTGAHLNAMSPDGDGASEATEQTILCGMASQNAPLADFFPDECQQLVEIVRREFNSLDDSLLGYQKCMFLDLTNRQTWLAQSFDMGESYCDLRYPFCYRPLLQFMFTQPLDRHLKRRLYDEWLLGMTRRVFTGTKRGLPGSLKLGIAIGQDRVKRLIDRCASPVGRMDWSRRVKRSWPWLRRALDIADAYGAFGALCRTSFQRMKKERFPVALLALAPLLAAEALRGGQTDIFDCEPETAICKA